MTSAKQSWPILPRAPITEALIDIRVQLPADVGIETFAQLHDDVREGYPTRDERRSAQAAFHVDPNQGVQMDTTPPNIDGYIFRSDDGTQVFQARLDGFTFSRLHPYESWQQLRDEAERLWCIYERHAKPVSITRLALRYINRIRIPLPAGELKQWLLTAPDIAPSLPQSLEGYFMQLVIPFEEHGVRAIVNQTIEAAQDEVLPLILDIDAFKDVGWRDARNLWNELEILRDVKNRVFFGTITQETEALFK